VDLDWDQLDNWISGGSVAADGAENESENKTKDRRGVGAKTAGARDSGRFGPRYKIHADQTYAWKMQLFEHAARAFAEREIERLHAKIGQCGV
jgi:hypothetical protein